MPVRRVGAVAAGFIAASLFLRALSIVWPFTVDDSFITFRYAKNLALGFGPTFNAGQPPIEGYTSVGWLLVMAVPHAIGADPVVFAKLTGIACTIACAWVVAQWSRDLATHSNGDETYAVALAPLSLAALGATAVHAVSGMETAMATLLFTAFLYLTYRIAVEWSARTLIVVALLGLAVPLVRPELLVSVGVTLGCLALAERSHARRIIVTSVLIIAVPFASYELWRMGYYGHLLPLPYYVKVADQSFAGLSNTRAFVRFVAWNFGAPIALGVWTIRRAVVPSIAGVVILIAIFVQPAPVMAYEWRYVFPAVPLLIVIASAGMASVPNRLRSIGMPRGASHLVAVGVGTALILLLSRHSGQRLREWRGYGIALMSAHGRLGVELARSPVRGVLAIGDAGAVPYFSGWQTIDTFGLNDVTIATTHRHDADEVLNRHVDVLILISSAEDQFEPQLPWETDLFRRAGAYGLHRVATRQFAPNYYLWVLAHNATAAGRAAETALTGGRTPPIPHD